MDKLVQNPFLAHTNNEGYKMSIDRKFKILAINPVNGNIHTDKDAILMCAKDKAVPAALRAYKAECEKMGSNPEHIQSIEMLIGRIELYQSHIGGKVPDTVGDAEIARCIGGFGV